MTRKKQEYQFGLVDTVSDSEGNFEEVLFFGPNPAHYSLSKQGPLFSLERDRLTLYEYRSYLNRLDTLFLEEYGERKAHTNMIDFETLSELDRVHFAFAELRETIDFLEYYINDLRDKLIVVSGGGSKDGGSQFVTYPDGSRETFGGVFNPNNPFPELEYGEPIDRNFGACGCFYIKDRPYEQIHNWAGNLWFANGGHWLGLRVAEKNWESKDPIRSIYVEEREFLDFFKRINQDHSLSIERFLNGEFGIIKH